MEGEGAWGGWSPSPSLPSCLQADARSHCLSKLALSQTFGRHFFVEVANESTLRFYLILLPPDLQLSFNPLFV